MPTTRSGVGVVKRDQPPRPSYHPSVTTSAIVMLTSHNPIRRRTGREQALSEAAPESSLDRSDSGWYMSPRGGIGEIFSLPPVSASGDRPEPRHMKTVEQARADWDSMSQTQREDWVEGFINGFLDEWGSEGVDDVTFNNEMMGDEGTYYPDSDTINIAPEYMDDFDATLDTAIHECIHAMNDEGGEVDDYWNEQMA